MTIAKHSFGESNPSSEKERKYENEKVGRESHVKWHGTEIATSLAHKKASGHAPRDDKNGKQAWEGWMFSAT